MFVSEKEDERRLLMAEMGWLWRIRRMSRRENVRNEKNHRRAGGSRNSGQDSSDLNMWSGLRWKDYQSQLYMDMWKKSEAEGGRERSGWTTSGKT